MRALWNALALVAIANLLGLGGLVGWLVMSGRLDEGRVEEIRAMLAETVAEEAAREAEEQAEQQERQQAEAELAAQVGEALPVASREVLEQRMEAVRLDRQRAERLRREVEDLKRTLTRERLAIDRDRDQLRRDQRSFDELRRKIEEVEGSEQFRNTLGVLKGLKATQSKTLLQTELDRSDADGSREDGMIRVTAYLDALPDRNRAKIMSEFVKDDPMLAAELLERLRTKGLKPAGADVDDPATADGANAGPAA
ncbi:MAG: hypothetical protein AAGG07_02020 [Planctomycetota bacterium]